MDQHFGKVNVRQFLHGSRTVGSDTTVVSHLPTLNERKYGSN